MLSYIYAKKESAMILTEEFFSQSAISVAPELVGKLLCRDIGGEVIKRRIVETECYFGEEDTACHAHKGRTPRTDIMYRRGGRAYIYLCYGIHELLNVTTGPDGHPEAVLIRGVEGAIGPGRATKLMRIDRTLNKMPLVRESGIWIEDDGFVPKIESMKRIGIGYASQEDQDRLWRYVLKS